MPVLHHKRYGAGQPVVFLGSVASTLEMWEPQLNALSHSYDVIALDHRGHGESPLIDAPTSVAELAEDVLETLDQLDVERFSVVGLSLGGAVAQHLSEHSGRVERAVLMCTAPKFGEESTWREREKLTREQGIAPMVDAISGLWFSKEFAQQQPATVDRFRTMIAGISGIGYAACCTALAVFDRRTSPALPVPTLTIAGDQDASTPPDVVAQLGSNSLVVRGGHVPTIESPEEINRALIEFLG
ncbi:alpha/beta fold hydrolase [Corynebacterium poyangense]|uniref:Alpha/beta fold hydrolase n=1 Tax=Corynebacterium poyangense TaxID=2684405 RepID=A0A7H0SQI4_9CORY|nr:alpha/beta fold hydrolase [Corynebacterium poyangense]QNQ90809.1 alpha/beta fold hydrolase [Corynebacterium poyangense]